MRTKTYIIIGAIALLPLAPVAARGSESESSGSGDGSRSTQQFEQRQQEVEQRQRSLEQQFEQRKTEVEKQRQARVSKLDAKKKEVCERINSNLQKRTTAGAQVNSRMDTRYKKVEERWQRLITRGKAAGVDTSKLEAALTEFTAKHEQFNTDFAALQQLKQSVPVSCDDPAALQAAKDKIKAARDKVKADAIALRDLRKKTQQEVVVPLLKAIAATKPVDDTKPETETKTNTGGTQ